MPIVDEMIQEAALAAGSKSLGCMDYERYKHRIALLNLNEEQHEAAIKRLAEVMGL